MSFPAKTRYKQLLNEADLVEDLSLYFHHLFLKTRQKFRTHCFQEKVVERAKRA